MKKQKVLIFEDVFFAYNSANVLENVSFYIESGEMNTVVGPNGGGKTTLLKLILGLLTPQRGKILLFDGSPEDNRHRVGYVPQHIHFDPQFPVSTADVVLMGRLGFAKGIKFSRADRQAGMRALERVGLVDLRHKLFSELSGGQRQRTLIARALATEPEMLLLDEPTANLDAQTENKLLDTISSLGEGLTLMMVSHDVGFVSDRVQKVICVNRRVIVHPTSHVSGDALKHIYGEDVRIIRHDLKWDEEQRT